MAGDGPRVEPLIAATTSACVACGSPLADRPIAAAGTRGLRPCPRCGTWTCVPRPTHEEQIALHNADGYAHHPYFEERRRDEVRQKNRCERVLRSLAQAVDVERLRNGCLLDVGCDTGSFLHAMSARLGCRGFGVEVSEWAAERARQSGLNVHHGPIEESPPEFRGFSLVTAVDVVEHVADPEALLRAIHDRTAPGGVVYLQTPNPASIVYALGVLLFRIDVGLFRSALARLFPAEHVQYFSARGLTALAQRCGFEVVRLETRALSAEEIMTGAGVRWLLMATQAVDRLRDRKILVDAILRRP
jgi:2-polyprenyl-3-methyl-5-hydroxy-6-metoxy-1,4-benzoquinol methylase